MDTKPSHLPRMNSVKLSQILSCFQNRSTPEKTSLNASVTQRSNSLNLGGSKKSSVNNLKQRCNNPIEDKTCAVRPCHNSRVFLTNQSFDNKIEEITTKNSKSDISCFDESIAAIEKALKSCSNVETSNNRSEDCALTSKISVKKQQPKYRVFVVERNGFFLDKSTSNKSVTDGSSRVKRSNSLFTGKSSVQELIQRFDKAESQNDDDRRKVNRSFSQQLLSSKQTKLKNPYSQIIESHTSSKHESKVTRKPDTGKNQDRLGGNSDNCAQVLYDLRTNKIDELDLCVGDRLRVLEINGDGWCWGERTKDGRQGWFPANYTSLQSASSPLQNTLEHDLV